MDQRRASGSEPFKTMSMTEPSPAWDRLLRAVGPLCQGGADGLAGLSEAEWAELLAECNRHWMTPFVYRALAAHRTQIAVPKAAWRGFKKMYMLSRARTRRADALLNPVLLAFNAAGIPVIALKGMHLSTQVYDDPSARPMIDADLLIRREHLTAAAAIVESFGFRQDKAVLRMRGQSAAREDRRHLGTFWYPNGPPIELHHDLAAPDALPGIEVEGLWRRASPARIGRAEVLVLSPEDTLLHLSIHAALHHQFGVKLLSLCDIPVLLHRWRDRIDWTTLWHRARAWEVERPVLITLALTQHRLGFPLPEGAAAPLSRHLPEMDTLMAIAERQMREKAAALARRRLPPRPTADVKAEVRLLAGLTGLPTLTRRAGFVARRIFLTRRELAASFGLTSEPLWLPVLYPVRLAGLLMRYVPGVLKHAWRPAGEDPEVRRFVEADRGRNTLMAWLREA